MTACGAHVPGRSTPETVYGAYQKQTVVCQKMPADDPRPHAERLCPVGERYATAQGIQDRLSDAVLAKDQAAIAFWAAKMDEAAEDPDTRTEAQKAADAKEGGGRGTCAPKIIPTNTVAANAPTGTTAGSATNGATTTTGPTTTGTTTGTTVSGATNGVTTTGGTMAGGTSTSGTALATGAAGGFKVTGDTVAVLGTQAVIGYMALKGGSEDRPASN
ncbi:hypothetical protein [Sphingomicrobium astaxanthinifaciens]|uniref:hypothetical protein n=1 Tax=Sphingomicrobium astaxanthinifaciens TaxID=1227949 RepID=UPI001FCC57F9|nr:hypothetical protein [Sphingomicrobium astaxanthinifaciens]MCJ7420831.1 hypothetical protein [Sphingomicrobium astaxanthinifaciens]